MGSTDLALALQLNALTIHPFVAHAAVFCAVYLPWLLVAAALVWLYRLSAPYREKAYIFITAVSAVFVSRGIITEGIRFFFHHPRPFVTHPEIHALFTEHEWSFPSGHAATFFALAAVVYRFNHRLGLFLFGASIIVTLSRVIAGVHYPSDIIGGALVGITTGYLVVRLFEKWKPKIVGSIV